MIPWLGTCLQLTKVKVSAVAIPDKELPTLCVATESILTHFWTMTEESSSSFPPQIVIQHICLAWDLKRLQLKMEIWTPSSLYFNVTMYPKEKKKDNRKLLLKHHHCHHNFKIAFVLNPHFPYQFPDRKLQVPTSKVAKWSICKYMFFLHTPVRDP